MPGARCAAASRAKKTKHTSIVTTVTPEVVRHSPRNGFNGFLRALPGDRLSNAHIFLVAELGRD